MSNTTRAASDEERVAFWLKAELDKASAISAVSEVSTIELPCDLAKAALDLLKGRAPVKPANYLPYGWLCGRCLQPLEGIYDYRPKYCPNCGKKVGWDD